MTQQELLKISAANDWVWEKWWPALMGLSKEQANQEVGGSYPSIFATAQHLVWAEMVWQARLEGGNTAKVFPRPPSSLKVLNRHWLELVPRRRAFLEAHNPKSKFTYQMLDGSTSTTALQDIIVHVTSHAHFHRGQLASQFRLLGLKPPTAHAIGFFRL